MVLRCIYKVRKYVKCDAYFTVVYFYAISKNCAISILAYKKGFQALSKLM